MGKCIDSYCNNCIYRAMVTNYMGCCTYLLRTDKRRPCPPGKGCTVKVRMKVRRKKKKEEKV